MSVRAVLLDVEGTTTPISFVTETLFPYARQHGGEFILNHLADEEIRKALLQLRVDNDADRRNGAPAIGDDAHDAMESTIRYYLWLMDADRKSTSLKTIQGRIWHEGYTRGELQTTIFPDVLPAMERWRQAGRVIAIYSSGSVLAQQELFRHTVQGDLTPFINAYFDTRVGGKKEVDSYRKIAESLELPTGQILFVSDTLAELDAALMAGTMTAWSARPGNPTIREQTAHPIIYSFEELP
jgi:enolase-phosphatase E1